jgi:radical SAM superfamily enzyme with C-terminal helix-hairpin-helix motif
LVSSIEQERLAPLASTVQSAMEKMHFDAIAAVHPDWEDVHNDPAFSEWVDSQPSYLRRAFAQVIESGTPGEVIEMLTFYKDSKKPKTPNGAKVQAATAVKVPRGSLPVKRGPAADDFDSAWDEAPD